ncbi:MAG: hypothetical protein KAW47_08800 [Thermoplasmatales archaeon]|nr:hypothetical protein [Thermoplasmatales archaeon]
MPKQKEKGTSKETAHKKGHDFEKKVAKWAKRYFNAGEVKTNILMNGLRVKRPYEIDVHVHRKRFLSEANIWIECKDISSSIKRTHIFKLKSSAEDIEDAYNVDREDFYFDRLAFVSTSKFDVDALSYADDNDIACFHYDGKKYELKNQPSWL